MQEGGAPNLQALDDLFWCSEYRDARGSAFRVRACIIDAMDEPQRTAEVHAWGAQLGPRLYGAGRPRPRHTCELGPAGVFSCPRGERLRIPGGILLHRIDTTLFTGTLANRSSISPGDPGTFWLPDVPDSLPAYTREICAEVWNLEKNLWDNPHGRAKHAWDCVYLLQALPWMLNMAK